MEARDPGTMVVGGGPALMEGGVAPVKSGGGRVMVLVEGLGQVLDRLEEWGGEGHP